MRMLVARRPRARAPAFGRRPGLGHRLRRALRPLRRRAGRPVHVSMGRCTRLAGATRGDPPPGHQRLPSQGGGHPGLSVGAVASHGPLDVRRPHGVVAPRAAAFDAEQKGLGFRIERVPGRVLLPTPAAVRRIRSAGPRRRGLAGRPRPRPAARAGRARPRWASLRGGAARRRGDRPGPAPGVAPGPGRACWPGPGWRCAPGAIPPPRPGGWPAPACRRWSRSPPASTPTGCDPSAPPARRKARAALGPAARGPLVVSVSRLVPRKGMDVLIDAAAALGAVVPGPDRGHRRRRARPGPARRPGAGHAGPRCGCSARCPTTTCPVSTAWPTSSSWRVATGGSGLEQEGFGIVFLEAAACGVAQVAGRSGGADEAVVDGETGLVVDDPSDPGHVAAALRRLLDRRRAAAPHGQGGPAPGRDRLRLGRPRT